jgi:hypothetical protein
MIVGFLAAQQAEQPVGKLKDWGTWIVAAVVVVFAMIGAAIV